MPKPSETTPIELDALVRVSRAKLIDQVNSTTVDAEAIVAKLETFVHALLAKHVVDLAGRLS